MNSEFKKELGLLLHDGLKTNPLRIEYEENVRELAALRDSLLANGHSVEEAAKILHERLTSDGFKDWYENRQFLSFDADLKTDILPCWSDSLKPSVEFARVAVSLKYQGCGISGKLFSCAFSEAKKRGFQGVRYLVAKTNERALRAYRKLRFPTVGECVYHGAEYWCCEKEI